MNLNVENTKAQMRKGVLEYCILSILSGEDMYNQGQPRMDPRAARLQHQAALSHRSHAEDRHRVKDGKIPANLTWFVVKGSPGMQAPGQNGKIHRKRKSPANLNPNGRLDLRAPPRRSTTTGCGCPPQGVNIWIIVPEFEVRQAARERCFFKLTDQAVSPLRNKMTGHRESCESSES